ncbi:MAG: ATP-binding protein [Acidimicrobiales bacterium]
MTSVPATIDPWADVIGQPHAVAALQAAASSGPVHAYLLLGPRGSGARQLARAFAAVLLSADLSPVDAARAVRLALTEKHPDLHVYERQGSSIQKDQIDDIIKEASRSAVEAQRKVLVLLDLDLAAPFQGPRLLKTIEEPPASTMFVVTAESMPPELVPIASRCVRIELDPVPVQAVVAALVAEGCSPERAQEVAVAAAGDLDRARLLASDERFSLRREAWYEAPHLLDGNGATVWRLTTALRSMIDDAQAPLDVRNARELAELDERIARYGERGAGRRELAERQKRAVRRHRTDELRFGLATLAARYRDELASGRAPGAHAHPLLAAIAAIDDANEALIRNPSEALVLHALLLQLPTIAHLPSTSA